MAALLIEHALWKGSDANDSHAAELWCLKMHPLCLPQLLLDTATPDLGTALAWHALAPDPFRASTAGHSLLRCCSFVQLVDRARLHWMRTPMACLAGTACRPRLETGLPPPPFRPQVR
jgi:hypothetical protein